MERKHNKKNVSLSKELRCNMTKEEKHLWYDFLRKYPIKFCRQKVLGKYIVDFYSSEANLVIEIDGAQHRMKDAVIYDKERTEYLEAFGLKVIRIPNIEINKNFYKMCCYIDDTVKEQLSKK